MMKKVIFVVCMLITFGRISTADAMFFDLPSGFNHELSQTKQTSLYFFQ